MLGWLINAFSYIIILIIPCIRHQWIILHSTNLGTALNPCFPASQHFSQGNLLPLAARFRLNRKSELQNMWGIDYIWTYGMYICTHL
jgi:hypothetical protein